MNPNNKGKNFICLSVNKIIEGFDWTNSEEISNLSHISKDYNQDDKIPPKFTGFIPKIVEPHLTRSRVPKLIAEKNRKISTDSLSKIYISMSEKHMKKLIF